MNVSEELKKLRSMADTGLLYCNNEFDRERYTELREMSFRLMQELSDHSVEDLKQAFPLAKDYPTAKVDIRALVLSPDKKILLVKEAADGQWSIPGGWADIGYSPAETAVKEVREEAGLDVKVQRLLAVFDKRKHGHPPHPLYVYKMVFGCEALSANIKKGFDVLDADYFIIDDLPPLSEERILKSQIEIVYQKWLSGDREAYFD